MHWEERRHVGGMLLCHRNTFLFLRFLSPFGKLVLTRPWKKLVKLVGTLLLYFDVQAQRSPGSGKGLEAGEHVEIPTSESYFFARMSDPLFVTVKERE